MSDERKQWAQAELRRRREMWPGAPSVEDEQRTCAEALAAVISLVEEVEGLRAEQAANEGSMLVDELRAERDALREQIAALRDVARWHLQHSACAGWPQGEALALAVDMDPEAPAKSFERILDLLGVEHEVAPDIAGLRAALADGEGQTNG